MKYLKTTALSLEIDNIISEAKKGIVVISPYLQLSEQFASKLKSANSKKIPLEIIYRQEKDDYYSKKHKYQSILELFTDYKTTEIRQYDNLHAKIYFNEEKAVITSLNLYAYSVVNNFEAGVLITKADEPEVFNSMLQDYLYLLSISKHIKGIELNLFKEESEKPAHRGFCIKCGKPITYNLDKPYCSKDLREWEDRTSSLLSDQDPVEDDGFCHSCGKKCDPRMSQPLCEECYNKEEGQNKKRSKNDDYFGLGLF